MLSRLSSQIAAFNSKIGQELMRLDFSRGTAIGFAVSTTIFRARQLSHWLEFSVRSGSRVRSSLTRPSYSFALVQRASASLTS
jgi:hypothetical protein